jgi:hypothetical protein
MDAESLESQRESLSYKPQTTQEQEAEEERVSYQDEQTRR